MTVTPVAKEPIRRRKSCGVGKEVAMEAFLKIAQGELISRYEAGR